MSAWEELKRWLHIHDWTEWSDMDDTGCWHRKCEDCGKKEIYSHWDSRCG